MHANQLCCDCTTRLTDAEVHWYGYRCERCEREWSERMDAYRLGSEDPELDRLYDLSEPEKPKH